MVGLARRNRRGVARTGGAAGLDNEIALEARTLSKHLNGCAARSMRRARTSVARSRPRSSGPSGGALYLNCKFAHKIDAPATLDVEVEAVNLTATRLEMRASSRAKRFELALDLFAEIDADASSWATAAVGRVVFTLQKRARAKWEKLLPPGAAKPANMHKWWDKQEEFAKELESLEKEEDRARKARSDEAAAADKALKEAENARRKKVLEDADARTESETKEAAAAGTADTAGAADTVGGGDAAAGSRGRARGRGGGAAQDRGGRCACAAAQKRDRLETAAKKDAMDAETAAAASTRMARVPGRTRRLPRPRAVAVRRSRPTRWPRSSPKARARCTKARWARQATSHPPDSGTSASCEDVMSHLSNGTSQANPGLHL